MINANNTEIVILIFVDNNKYDTSFDVLEYIGYFLAK